MASAAAFQHTLAKAAPLSGTSLHTGAKVLKLERRFDVSRDYVRLNTMRVARLQNALDRLTAAIRDVEAELAAVDGEHDPLASHIFISLPPLSERQRHERRKAPGGERTAEFQHRL